MRRIAIFVLLVTAAFAQDGRKARDLASQARSAAFKSPANTILPLGG
jgi:hypothetical protein